MRVKNDFFYVWKKIEALSVPKVRIVVVYNPRSSKAKEVSAKVLEPIRRMMFGWQDGDGDVFRGRANLKKREKNEADTGFGRKTIALIKYEVKPTNVDDNAAKISEILQDGDVVLTAGGDGTATIGLNGAILSQKQVYFWALPFGNFNDLPRSLFKVSKKVEDGRKSPARLYPLEILADGEVQRYAGMYATIGMFAESVKVFDQPKVRKHLQRGKKSFIYSLYSLMIWYLRERKKRFVPNFWMMSRRGGDKSQKIVNSGRVTDYMAINGVTAGKMMRGGEYFLEPKVFLSVVCRLSTIFRMGIFMMRSLFFRIPGGASTGDEINFDGKTDLEIQSEGECLVLRGVSKIKIQKSKKFVDIL